MSGGEEACGYCVIAILAIILWLFIANRVYHRAEEVGLDPTYWAVIAFLFGLFGLLFFENAVKRAESNRQSSGGAGFPVHGGVYGGQSSGKGGCPNPGQVHRIRISATNTSRNS